MKLSTSMLDQYFFFYSFQHVIRVNSVSLSLVPPESKPWKQRNLLLDIWKK